MHGWDGGKYGWRMDNGVVRRPKKAQSVIPHVHAWLKIFGLFFCSVEWVSEDPDVGKWRWYSNSYSIRDVETDLMIDNL